MANIGSLTVKVRADSSPLRGDLRKASGSIGGFRGNLDKASGSMGGFRNGIAALSPALGGLAMAVGPVAVALAALVVAKKVFSGFKTIAAEIDAVAKSARLLGVELVALEGLKFGGELSGVDPSKVIGGLKTMQKRIGEAARGSGAAIPALDELGLNAEDLVGQDAIKSLIDIADAFAGIEEPARRAAIASNIFSKGNMEMLLLVSQGGDAIRDQIGRMRDLSVITSTTAKEFELFNDRSAAAGMVWDKFWDRIALGGIRAMNIMADLDPRLGVIVGAIDEAGGLTGDLGDNLEDMKAIGAFEDLGEDAAVAAKEIEKLAETARSAGKTLIESLGGKLDIVVGIDPVDAQIKDTLTDAFKDLPFEEFLDLAESIHEVKTELDAATRAAAAMKEATRAAAMGDSLIKGIEDSIALETGLSPMDLRIRNLGEQGVDQGTLDRAKDLVKELSQAKQLAAGIELGDSFIKGLEDAIALEGGLSPMELQIRDLEEQGLDQGMLDQAEGLVKELEQAKKLAADIELGESLTAQFRTPMEEFVKVAEDLDRLLDVGAISEATAGLALGAAEDTLAASVTTPDVFTGRAELGSAEAYRTILRAQAGGGAVGPQEKILLEGEKQTAHLSNLNTAVEIGVEKLDPQEVAETMP